MIPSPGRIVLFVLTDGPHLFGSGHKAGEAIPAMITRVNSDGTAQLTGYTDLHFDRRGDGIRGFMSGNRIPQDAEKKPGTWHEPPRVGSPDIKNC